MAKRLSGASPYKESAQMARARTSAHGYSTWAVFANGDGDWHFYYEDEED